MAASEKDGVRDWMRLALGALVAYRVIYHSAYLRDVPFALATFSDGRQYELAALDIVANPPLGTEAFYLQGLYAYFMAVPMAIRPWPSLALLSQIVLAVGVLYLFHRVARRFLGPREGMLATIVLLAFPTLAFYENKFVTAELAIATTVGLIAAVGWTQARPSRARFVVCGVALGIGILARPYFVLVTPFVVWAIVVIVRAAGRPLRADLLAGAAGLFLAVAPMSARNLAVSGTPTLFPAHGGGTSFYIGNNQHAEGVWNNADGLLSGDVSRESSELTDELGVVATDEGERARAIGRALYRRAFSEITDDPGRWLWLELRKAWLLLGNDELHQDYDRFGEQEMIPFAHRVGVPFAILLALGVLGVRRMKRRLEPEQRPVTIVLLGIAAAVVAINLLYFTSSQHRLALCIPLALVAPFGIRELFVADRRRRYTSLGIAVLVAALSFYPRSRKSEPSAVHYYNLAVAYISTDQPRLALPVLDRAVQKRPDHPVIRLERAALRRKFGEFQGAHDDLQAISRLDGVPAWVQARAEDERRRLP